MERSFQIQLDDIRRLLLSMGGLVERALELVTTGLIEQDLQKFAAVFSIEEQINRSHLQLDEACTNYLAVQGPVAGDLRMVVSAIKINVDLERMGDQCINMAHTGRDFVRRTTHLSVDEIRVMSRVAREMVKEALDSFVRRDMGLAQKILVTDDELDVRKQNIFESMVGQIKLNAADVEAGLDLILIARNLERIGDHATNIAEDVIYFSTGKDIRHGKYA
ncbi:MAG: phosphate transport system regulatory protein PhoU [Bdellovibrio sp.]|nr:MAG: phosphate transport system regulatory protein PhoU [Bdellovibrio sp.]